MMPENFYGGDVKLHSSEYPVFDRTDPKDGDRNVFEMDKPWPFDDVKTNKDDSPGEYSTEMDKPFTHRDYQITEASDRSENVREVITRNSSLEGDIHPVTGVPFERKQVVDANGEKVEGVFPVFDSTLDIQLPEDLYQASDKEQFDYCNERLKEAYEQGELDDAPFDERQREQIANGEKPQGYTWHHNEELGKMQLVETETHDKTGHTGGKVIWGGGQDAR